MSEVYEWEVACKRLAELTRSGQIKWASHRDLSYEEETDDDRTVGPIYLTTYADKTIAVYEYRTRVFTGEEDWHWEPGVSIEFVEQFGYSPEKMRCLWRWPEGPGARSLLEAIRYQLSQADAFLSRILSETSAG